MRTPAFRDLKAGDRVAFTCPDGYVMFGNINEMSIEDVRLKKELGVRLYDQFYVSWSNGGKGSISVLDCHRLSKVYGDD